MMGFFIPMVCLVAIHLLWMRFLEPLFLPRDTRSGQKFRE